MSETMRRMVALQCWLAAMLLADAVFVETGNRRWLQPLSRVYYATKAYSTRDHTGEVVFLGSSLVGCSIVPGAIEDELAAQGIDVRVWNLWFAAALVPAYQTALRDLIAQHGLPRLLVIGAAPRAFNANSPRTVVYARYFGSVGDVLRLVRAKPWGRHHLLWPLCYRAPSATLQMVGMPMVEDKVRDYVRRQGGRWWYMPDNPERAEKLNAKLAGSLYEDRYRRVLSEREECLENFTTGDFGQWFERTIEQAREMGIEPAVCLYGYSDRARRDLDGGCLAELETWLEALAQRLNFPLWRSWEVLPNPGAWDTYFDGVDHMTPASAMVFSRRLARGPLVAMLGRIKARRARASGSPQ